MEQALDRQSRPIIFQIVGYKNSGKTTLVAELTRRFKQDGFTVGTAKRDAHDFTIDTPGTDTWKHQEAGADVTAISSSARSAVLRSSPMALSGLLAYMQDADIILVEGFKRESYPKLILLRSIEDIHLLQQLSSPAAAVIWSADIRQALENNPDYSKLAILDIRQPDAIYLFLRAYIKAASSHV